MGAGGGADRPTAFDLFAMTCQFFWPSAFGVAARMTSFPGKGRREAVVGDWCSRPGPAVRGATQALEFHGERLGFVEA